MKIRIIVSFLALFFTLQPVAGEAFVPQTPHLLHLVIQKIKQPVGIETLQTKTIFNPQMEEEEGVLLQEKMMYKYPGQLRSQLLKAPVLGFTVESDFKFIKVADQETVSRKKSAIDLYTDVLLYRDHETLAQQLVNVGVDTQTVTFKRFDKIICYVIGSSPEPGEPFSGLWIEKETFLPLRYVVKTENWVVECLYSDWQKISKTWYPMQVRIVLDNQLFASIQVETAILKGGFSSQLFDISQIERLYPADSSNAVSEEARQVEELNKRIEEFKKLYE